MDAERLDALARALGARTSRRLLAGLAGVPLLGGLAALVDLDEAAAKKSKKKCKKQRKTICNSACGIVTDKCKKKIDCGACTCDVCASGCQFTTVQAAIDAASSGDTIHLCAGTYTRPSPNAAVASIIDKNLTLIGAGAEQTILDGGGVASTQPVIEADETTTSLQQLTVTGAKGRPGISLLSEGAVLTLTQVTVRDNDNDVGNGGGIVNFGGTVNLDAGTVVRNNHTDFHGGGIYNSGGTVTLNDGVSVRDNEADDSTGGTFNQGGGIYNNAGHVTLKNGARVSGNEAAESGGGFYMGNSMIRLSRWSRAAWSVKTPRTIAPGIAVRTSPRSVPTSASARAKGLGGGADRSPRVHHLTGARSPRSSVAWRSPVTSSASSLYLHGTPAATQRVLSLRGESGPRMRAPLRPGARGMGANGVSPSEGEARKGVILPTLTPVISLVPLVPFHSTHHPSPASYERSQTYCPRLATAGTLQNDGAAIV